jgi:lipopolysaccharide/colanic/teichoic acid biosynthesis glycosyltransferase
MEPAIQKPTERHTPPRISARHTPPALDTTPLVEPRPVARLTQVRDHADLDPRRPEWPRRILNVVAASALIVATLPIMVVIAVLVKLSSKGPAIYKQTRVGLDRRAGRAPKKDSRRAHDIGGLPFTIYKFRTMRVDAEKESGAVWASNDDARVTPIGRILRQFRLDELPQLFNVLRGDMNLVGPRPERPELFEKLRKEIPDYQKRQLARPGLTGWAQVNQSYDTSVEDVKRKVQFDIEYIRRRGLSEDLKIMLRTVPVILFRRGGW